MKPCKYYVKCIGILLFLELFLLVFLSNLTSHLDLLVSHPNRHFPHVTLSFPSIQQQLLSLSIDRQNILNDENYFSKCDCKFKQKNKTCGLVCKRTLPISIVCLNEITYCSGYKFFTRPSLFDFNEYSKSIQSIILMNFFSDETVGTSEFRPNLRGQLSRSSLINRQKDLASKCSILANQETLEIPRNHTLIETDFLNSLSNKFHIIKWVQRNPIAIHPLIQFGVPFGVFRPDELIQIRNQIRQSPPILINRRLMYANFAVEGDERECLAFTMKKNNWETFSTIRLFEPDTRNDEKILSNQDYYKEMSQHIFLISPRGNGLDCIRTWEALYLGVIPVLLRRSPVYDGMFSGLPVLFVNSYEEISEEFLRNSFIQMEYQKYRLDILTLDGFFEKVRD